MKDRISFTPTDSLLTALREEAQKQKISESALIRNITAEYLSYRGYRIDLTLPNWGGYRPRKLKS